MHFNKCFDGVFGKMKRWKITDRSFLIFFASLGLGDQPGGLLDKETQGKANKWEEIQFEFRLSEAQKGSFFGETENSRWKCKIRNFSQNTTKLVDVCMKIRNNPYSGNFSPTFMEDNNVVFGWGTFPHLHTFLRRVPYNHWSDLPLVHAGTDRL